MMEATVGTTSNRSDCCRPPRHPSALTISTAAGPIFPAAATSQGVIIPSFHPVSSWDCHSPDPAQIFPPCASRNVTIAQDPFKDRGNACETSSCCTDTTERSLNDVPLYPSFPALLNAARAEASCQLAQLSLPHSHNLPNVEPFKGGDRTCS